MDIHIHEDKFKLTEDTIKGIRYIKLNKKANYLEKGLDSVIDNEGTQVENEAIQYYTFGFYDSLTCISKNEITSLVHKEHFLISYPFEKTANTLKVEQWFGIFPLSNKKIYKNIAENEGIESAEAIDPFFCGSDLQKKLPFIGVVLISLGDSLESEQFDSFKKMLEQYVEVIEGLFGETTTNMYVYIAEIYYSLNCADLCLAVRTNALPFIHYVNYELKRRAVENRYDINTTVIFAVQENVREDELQKCITENEKVSFVVRSEGKCDKRESKGVNGIGNYVTSFSYGEYMEMLPELIHYKLGETSEDEKTEKNFWHGMIHEREWFEESGEYREFTSIRSNKTEKLQAAICSWIKEVHDKIKSIEKYSDELFTYEMGMYKYKEKFLREIRLIVDLVHTYSDLWYQNASENGFVFFSQLFVALQGIEANLEEIKNGNAELRISVESLLEVMNCITSDLNGYNKQVQFLNQDSVNYPNYEIQSKVNAEKYMSAYSSFLRKFFVLYYQDKDRNEKSVQNLPMALVNLQQREITAHIYFHEVYGKNTREENKKFRGIFAVCFPSSEYFSDLWLSIPLLMHEASHMQHYGETKDRNHAVIFNIDHFFAKTIALGMLRIVNDGIMISTSSILVEILDQKIYEALVIHRDKFFDRIDNWEKWGYQSVISNCADFYRSLYDRHESIKGITYNQLKKLKEKIKGNVDYILQIIGFGDMFDKYEMEDISALSYFANTLYLMFHPDFYVKNKTKYDDQFLEIRKSLDTKTCDTDDNNIREMLLFASYCFFKYLMCDLDKIPDSLKQNEDGIWEVMAVSFYILQIAAMRAVFEKYCHSFDKEISEVIYYDGLIPNIGFESLYVFSEKIISTHRNYENKEPSEHDRSLMDTMFREYYEIYVSINNIIKFMKDKQHFMNDKMSDVVSSFIKDVHDECKKYVRDEESKPFSLIFGKTNREQITKLGFFEESSSILQNVFEKYIEECDNFFVRRMIDDRSKLFKEIYADCGMCRAMGFDPFGYCMFAISSHLWVDDKNFNSPESNFLADRIRAVLQMYFVDSDKKSLRDIFGEFFNKLFDEKMIEAIGAILLQISEVKEAEGKVRDALQELKLQKDQIEEIKRKVDTIDHLSRMNFQGILSIWRDMILGKLMEAIETIEKRDKMKCPPKIDDGDKYEDKLSVAKTYLFRMYNIMQLFEEEDILAHIPIDMFDGFFQKIKNHMDEGRGIKFVKRNACVEEIGLFYNIDSPEGVENKFEWYYDLYSKGFIKQCNFIFDNYCEYRNAYSYLKRRVNVRDQHQGIPDIGEWNEIIDMYYQEGEK